MSEQSDEGEGELGLGELELSPSLSGEGDELGDLPGLGELTDCVDTVLSELSGGEEPGEGDDEGEELGEGDDEGEGEFLHLPQDCWQ